MILMVTPSTAAVAQSPCYNQQNDLLMMNDMNNDIAEGKWPMIPTGMGGGEVVDLSGQVTDFKIISDNGGLLDCTLLLTKQTRQEKIRIRYWKNIAGQFLHEVSFSQ
jgi:hypothetical protein